MAKLKFLDTYVSKEERFSLGIEKLSGKFYFSIPVSNALVDYEEYYEIDEESYREFKSDLKAALNFAGKCRNHEVDNLLFFEPGNDRGTPT